MVGNPTLNRRFAYVKRRFVLFLKEIHAFMPVRLESLWRITMKAHLELLPSQSQNYVIRFFEDPIGEVDPTTGQPWKAFCAACFLHVVDGVGEVKGLTVLPRGALSALRALSVPTGLREVFWERWEDGKKRRVRVPLG